PAACPPGAWPPRRGRWPRSRWPARRSSARWPGRPRRGCRSSLPRNGGPRVHGLGPRAPGGARRAALRARGHRGPRGGRGVHAQGPRQHRVGVRGPAPVGPAPDGGDRVRVHSQDDAGLRPRRAGEHGVGIRLPAASPAATLPAQRRTV
ncbi:unnamed protein product, partial [Prorocentrum cordatum]